MLKVDFDSTLSVLLIVAVLGSDSFNRVRGMVSMSTFHVLTIFIPIFIYFISRFLSHDCVHSNPDPLRPTPTVMPESVVPGHVLDWSRTIRNEVIEWAYAALIDITRKIFL